MLMCVSSFDHFMLTHSDETEKKKEEEKKKYF